MGGPPAKLSFLNSPYGSQKTPEEIAAIEKRQAEYEQTRRQREDEMRGKKICDLFEVAGTSKRHHVKKLEELQKHQNWASAYQRACEIIDHGEMLVLLGTLGNGKTQMGVQLIRRACVSLRNCMYLRCREVGMELRKCYGSRAEGISERKAIAAFCRPDLLVLDECQEKADTEWEQRSLTLILDKRYGDMKPTVLIANGNENDLPRILGRSASDRIQEGGGVLLFNWESFRRKR